jgi:hypothetical protein
VPIVEAAIPMLDKVGIKVKVKPVETSALGGVIRKRRLPGLHLVEHLGPGSADRAEVLPLGDAAIGLQLYDLQERRVRQADRRRFGQRTIRQAASTSCKKANALATGRSPGLVLQLQQGGHGLSALAARPPAERDRARAQRYEELWVDDHLAGREVIPSRAPAIAWRRGLVRLRPPVTTRRSGARIIMLPYVTPSPLAGDSDPACRRAADLRDVQRRPRQFRHQPDG